MACLLLALSSILPAELMPACIAYMKESLYRSKVARCELDAGQCMRIIFKLAVW